MREVKNLWTLSVQTLKKGSVDWHFEQAVFCGRFGCLQPYSPFLVFASDGKGRYTQGDMWQRQIASCELENLSQNCCRCNRILSQQQVAQIQIGLIFGDLLRQQKD